ncbi:hypothetical protein K488DRAFT_83992 [Vararia minispora EC-137]|uniref:Uncharacterized protein n=1 Tax=Vararia minispora EC-137 TaxID=1314806 RepID=A0ACB8QS32_9AGAM|nr:hypothetical protein K488DRAFT_83992 [Vararia minispora EC-137]
MSGSSRLKRKLDEQGVNYSTGRATENFCLIGTPLPPLDKSKDIGEFVPLWKQEVRDEKGRRRLHGAFTGGFSAGYFNTVGSKEGWTPQTFVSSRNDRAKHKASRMEDFMDDEDLAALREEQLTKGVQAQQRDAFETQPVGGTQEDDSLARSIQRALMPPPEDSPGMVLLRKMGWRPGQGIGPRITWRQRKIQDILASGRSLNDINVDKLAEDEDSEALKHMFPPRDTVAPVLPRKKDVHGLGFVPGDGLDSRSRSKSSAGPKLSAGFGLGALNDADEDDLDVYDTASHRERTYMPYDAADRELDDNITLPGRKASTSQRKLAQPVKPATQTFKDGSQVLAGFVLSNVPVMQDLRFPLPDIPAGWTSDPRRVWGRGGENEAPTASADKSSWRNNLTATERGSILGETPLPRAAKSVFEYMSQKDRDRIQSAATNRQTTKETTHTPEPSLDVPFTPADIASAALKGFMPFTTDPLKQARYVAYLGSQAEGAPPPAVLPGQSVANYRKELSDYAKSAVVFKPVTGAMAGRFTSAAVVDTGPKIIEGLYQPVHTSDDDAAESRRREEAQKRDEERERHRRDEEEAVEGSRAHAVKFGMYGALTREVVPWQPARLLCKRFGVKDPNPDIAVETPMPGAVLGSAMVEQGREPEQTPKEAGYESNAGATSTLSENVAPGGRSRRNLDNVGLGEDDDQGRDTLTYVRPSMDVFKAIFASDDEDSDKEDDGPDARHDATMTGPAPGPSRPSTPTPPHLRKEDVEMNTYELKEAPVDDKPVDIATFKPVFVARAAKDVDKDNSKSLKKNKDKRKAKAIVSFADEEEDGGLQIAPTASKSRDSERPKKRRKKDKAKEDGGTEEDMWVEKPPPEIVQTLETVPVQRRRAEEDAGAGAGYQELSADSAQVPSAARARKKAIDFM